MPLLVSALVTGRPFERASACAFARIDRRSVVISSASSSFKPNPKRWGASRLSGRVTTLPPAPADPRGRPWHNAQLSTRPAPMMRLVLMSPEPSPSRGPCPCCLVNFRWKSCRPRRIARNGSRLMMNTDESGVERSPRPAPISCVRDLAIPSPAELGAWVLSINCPGTGLTTAITNPIAAQAPSTVTVARIAVSLHSSLRCADVRRYAAERPELADETRSRIGRQAPKLKGRDEA